MDIEIIPCLNDNYSYLLKDNQTDTVAIIDPSEFGPCDKKINQKYKKLDFILNTHHHFDHVGGNVELKKKYGSKSPYIEKKYTKTKKSTTKLAAKQITKPKKSTKTNKSKKCPKRVWKGPPGLSTSQDASKLRTESNGIPPRAEKHRKDKSKKEH